MANVLFFGPLADAAGVRRVDLAGASVGEVVDEARRRYGERFESALDDSCRVWVNGEPAARETPVELGDEVAFLPPVSGG